MAHQNQIHPWLANQPHDAGMTERAIKAGEGQARRGDALDRAAIVRSQRNPVSNRAASYDLPAVFVAEALPRLEALLRIGQWDKLHLVVDQLALEYELRAKETTVPGPTNGTLAAKHVTWLNLPMRTTNMLEAAGMFTVGGLLEGFPKQLVGLTNCGPDSVKAIAKALVRCNAMTTEDAALRVQAWYAAMERR